MAINKVELCGVNTSRLPVLNAEEKETLLKKAAKEMLLPANATFRAICALS